MDRPFPSPCASPLRKTAFRGLASVGAFLYLVIFSSPVVSSQELFLDTLLEDDIDIEDILSEIPPNLNPDTATESDLKMLPCFDERQIRTFLTYRDSLPSGESIYEHLEEIPSLGSLQILILRAFKDSTPRSAAPMTGAFRTGMSLSPAGTVSDSKYYASADIDRNGRFKLGLRMERDPLEPRAVDAVSGYFLLRDGEKGYVLLGDYRPDFGQGLLWSRNTRSYTSGASVLRKASSRPENTSWEESLYLRGAMASVRHGIVSMKAWVSSRDLDASLDDSGHAVTIHTTGLHVSDGTRGNLHERIAGAGFSVQTRKGSVHLSASSTGYDPALSRKTGEQYRNAPESASFRYLSSNGDIAAGNAVFFYEAAFMNEAEHAAQAGIRVHSRKTLAGILLRDYSRGYWAPRSAALSSFGSTGNERGIYSSLETALSRRTRLTASLDLARSIGRTWLSPLPSSRRRVTLSAERTVTRLVRASLTYRSTHESDTASGRWSLTGKVGIRSPWKSGPDLHALAACTSAVNRYGRYGEVGTEWERGFFRLSAASGIFNIPEYGARYYRYERNVPGRGYSTAVWGKGFSLVVVARMGILSLRYRMSDSDRTQYQQEAALQGDWRL